ncbi:conserved hypothetical protein [Sphingomonas sp. EC-HK361]|jgi:predicted metal-binding protein|uniref:(2Fe-2S) ferredoxin domain-containing protein n=1 Tax=Sphingomonas sp. EC-HK361 TaxID=2038397 RepID=UPI001252BC32|nr:(2Fe-2S) ferredoxin domain-containing protein [Sphingomonas sp. EC-HK361]VVT12939.1 conserved hypothetical protein [Sphingomonas sp. EC-HK361]
MAAKLIRAEWQGAILVCGKCSKKLGGGYGRKGKTSLAKALRKALALGKGRKARLGVVETRCLGICPKHAVTMIDTREPGRWHVVPANANVEALARGLR